MSQKLADNLRDEFRHFSGIECTAKYMEKGVQHQALSALPSKKQGVYVFLLDKNCCFKVGKAGVKSKARWNSHHYNFDEKTSSTLPKSIMKDLRFFKSFFPVYLHDDIEDFKNLNIKNWIMNNISRIEFVISEKESKFALNLLESFIQFKLKPIYEGKQIYQKVV